MKRSRIRRRCPRMKRVPRWSGFALRERERETEKHNDNRVPTKEKKKGYVCMKNA